MKKILALLLIALFGLALCVSSASAQCVTSSVVQSAFVSPFVQTQVVVGTPLFVAPSAVGFVNGGVANVNVVQGRGFRFAGNRFVGNRFVGNRFVGNRFVGANVVGANVIGGGAVANVNIANRGGLFGRRRGSAVSVQAVGGAGGAANVNVVQGRRR